MTVPYPRRLIEVDLPIARISAHARRENSIRHGRISTLHIWWARRPLAACRAVICAALWPDPADEHCPPAFREAAVEAIKKFACRVFPPRINEESHQLQEGRSTESRGRWEAISGGTLMRHVKQEAEKELAEFYPKDEDGATPITYLWARTIQCEGPGCNAEVPLIRSLWLARKGDRSIALRLVPSAEAMRVEFEIISNAQPKE